MKIKFINSLPMLALLSTINPLLSTFAQGTAFTNQGRLADSGNPANGTYDLRFAIYNAASAGNPVGNVITSAGTSVSDGLFTVTLDFGAAVFDGNARWLEIGARTNGGIAIPTRF